MACIQEHSNTCACRWCGHSTSSGNLLLCDFCPNTWCEGKCARGIKTCAVHIAAGACRAACIEVNLGKEVLQKACDQAEADSWKCLSCDAQQLSAILSTAQR